MFDKDLINRLPASVKWIAQNGAGYEAVDVEACRLRGIYVSNTPVVVDDATATTALYLLISTFRQFSLAERSLRKSDWKPSAISSGCRDLAGQTLAILGLGGIGTRLAVLAHTFSMRIVYHSRHEHPAAPGYCKYFENLEAMLPEADVLSLHIPLRPGTVNLIDGRLIRMLKPGAIIINTARGRVMDEEALIQALEDGHLAGAGLDVFPEEPQINPRLLELTNVALLPHMGTETQGTQRAMEIRALANLKDFLVTGTGRDLVVEYQTRPKL